MFLVGVCIVVRMVLFGVVRVYPCEDLIGLELPMRWMASRANTIRVFRGARLWVPYLWALRKPYFWSLPLSSMAGWTIVL